MIQINPEKAKGLKSVFTSSQKTFPDLFRGSIVNLSDVEFGKKNDNSFKKNYKEQCSIEGEWTNTLKFNNEKYWGIGEYKVLPFYQHDFTLPSDSSKRLDLINIIVDRIDESQKAKESLEEQQRKDRKLREDYINNVKKNKK